MPECLKEAVKTKKLGSIQAAHALFKTWEEYPKETEEFLESKERISTSEAKKFDPKSWYVPTFSENTEGKIEETDENQESLNTSKLERESAISDIGATQYEDVGKEKVFAETNDSSGNDVLKEQKLKNRYLFRNQKKTLNQKNLLLPMKGKMQQRISTMIYQGVISPSKLKRLLMDCWKPRTKNQETTESHSFYV